MCQGGEENEKFDFKCAYCSCAYLLKCKPSYRKSSVNLKCAPHLKCKILPADWGRAHFSTYLRHLLQMRYLQAACTELVHPERGFVLQRGAAGVEGVGEVIIQQAADGGHVDVWETTQASGEVSGVVTRPEYAAKLRVEQVLHHHPAKITRMIFQSSRSIQFKCALTYTHLSSSLSFCHSWKTILDSESWRVWNNNNNNNTEEN